MILRHECKWFPQTGCVYSCAYSLVLCVKPQLQPPQLRKQRWDELCAYSLSVIEELSKSAMQRRVVEAVAISPSVLAITSRRASHTRMRLRENQHAVGVGTSASHRLSFRRGTITPRAEANFDIEKAWPSKRASEVFERNEELCVGLAIGCHIVCNTMIGGHKATRGGRELDAC